VVQAFLVSRRSGAVYLGSCRGRVGASDGEESEVEVPELVEDTAQGGLVGDGATEGGDGGAVVAGNGGDG